MSGGAIGSFVIFKIQNHKENFTKSRKMFPFHIKNQAPFTYEPQLNL